MERCKVCGKPGYGRGFCHSCYIFFVMGQFEYDGAIVRFNPRQFSWVSCGGSHLLTYHSPESLWGES